MTIKKVYPVIGGPLDATTVKSDYRHQKIYLPKHVKNDDGVWQVIEHEYEYSPRLDYGDGNIAREGYYHNKVIVT